MKIYVRLKKKSINSIGIKMSLVQIQYRAFPTQNAFIVYCSAYECKHLAPVLEPGRQARLRIWCPYGRVSSNLTGRILS